MSVEAMKQALEELQYVLDSSTNEDLPLHGNSFNKTISILEQAIEQANHIPDTTKMMPTSKDSLQVEAMKQALEALSNTDTHPISSTEQYFKETQAMEALQDAIDDAEEQKPVAWGMVRDGEICDCITPAEHEREQGEYNVPLYAAPPQREWVGLTDHDIHQLRQQGAHSVSDKEFRMIEAKLKEKNT